jgi:hypothetical protein
MPLSEQFPVLYNVARWKEVTVREVLLMGSLNLTFRQTIIGDKLTEWNKMTTKIAKVRLSSKADSCMEFTFQWQILCCLDVQCNAGASKLSTLETFVEDENPIKNQNIFMVPR